MAGVNGTTLAEDANNDLIMRAYVPNKFCEIIPKAVDFQFII